MRISTIAPRALRLFAAAVVALTWLLAAPPVLAQVAEVNTARLESPPPLDLQPVANELHLPLEQAVAISLERNLALLLERHERTQFHLGLEQSLGIYDLFLSADARATDDTSPTLSAIQGAPVLQEESLNVSMGLNQLTPWGGVGRVGYNVFRRESNSVFATLNPAYQAGLDLGFSQPLLRDFGRSITERGIRVARLNSAISRETFEQQVVATIQRVGEAYWALVEAREQLGVAQESLELARELHQMNLVRVEVGTMAPLELVQSEVGIATREEEIIRSRARVENAEDQLRRLLNLDSEELWDVAIVPATDPEMERVEITLETALATALERRPELEARALRNQALELDARFFHNQALPRLDVGVSYGLRGVGGDLLVDDGSVIRGGLGDAIDQVIDSDFESWTFTVTAAYPLQNRQARARRAQADLDVEQGRVAMNDLQQGVRLEVRSAVRAVTTAAQQIDSARASVHLAERNLEAEQRRYENGLSTSFQVLQIQEDLTAARSRLVSAITSYRRAMVDYHRATGTLLEASGVELTDPLTPQTGSRFAWR
jgi:outer membrane protein